MHARILFVLALTTILMSVDVSAQGYKPNQEILHLEGYIRNHIPIGTPASDAITTLAALHPVYARIPEANTLIVGYSSKASLVGVSSSIFLTIRLSEEGLVQDISAQYANTGP